MPYFGDAYHFSKQSGTAVFSVHDMLGGGPLLERLQFQCMDRDEPLWGGHLPDETVTAPCAPHGGVRPGKDSTLNILYDSVIASLAVPDIMSGYVARHVLLGDATHRNVNYRINKIGINLVANGLLDCNAPGVEDPDSCPRNQTVEYVLTHDGSVGLENLLGEHRFYHLYDGVLSSTALANGTVLSEPLDPVSQVPYFAPFEQTALHARPLAGMYKLVLRSRNELVWQNLEDLQVFVDYEFWAPQGLTNQPQLTESAPAPIR
jgi:hypothetical protein